MNLSMSSAESSTGSVSPSREKEKFQQKKRNLKRKREEEEFAEMCPVWTPDMVYLLVKELYNRVIKNHKAGRKINVHIKSDDWIAIAATITKARECVLSKCLAPCDDCKAGITIDCFQVKSKMSDLKSQQNQTGVCNDIIEYKNVNPRSKITDLWKVVVESTTKITMTNTTGTGTGKRKRLESGEPSVPSLGSSLYDEALNITKNLLETKLLTKQEYAHIQGWLVTRESTPMEQFAKSLISSSSSSSGVAAAVVKAVIARDISAV